MPRCPLCQQRFLAGTACPRDGFVVSLPSAAEAPPPVGLGLRFGEPPACGGFADVWPARDSHDRKLAFKLARSADSATAKRFGREARALLRVGEPWAPRLLDHGLLDDGRAFLALPWLEHATLAEWLERCDSPPKLEELLSVGAAVLECLVHVVESGVLHRDLKPENLIVRSKAPRFAVTAIDFGSARLLADGGEAPADAELRSDVTAEGVVVGTREYLAPERIQGRLDDERSEVYAAGVLLYELATLRVPFSFGRAVLHAQVAFLPPPPTRFAALPKALEALLLECLAKDPERRPPSLRALRDRFVALRARASLVKSREPDAARLLHRQVEPVVLLFVELSGNAVALSRAVVAGGGFLARMGGGQALAVFPGRSAHSPLDAAIAVALRIREYDATCALGLHLSRLSLRELSDGAYAASGEAVERPESWLGAPPRPPLLVTNAFAHAAGEGRLRALRHQMATGAAPDATPLVGFEALTAELTRSLAEFHAGTRPAFVHVRGASGAGKTRMAEAAATLARESGVAHIIDRKLMRRQHGRVSARHLLEALPGYAAPSAGASEGELSLALTSALEARSQEPTAIILDDLHSVDEVVLKAIEATALRGPGRRLWVLSTSPEESREPRAHWGERVVSFRRLDLQPLTDAAACELLRALLAPAAYVPSDALEWLARATGKRPGAMVQVCRSIHRTGLVRERAQTASHYLDTAELANLPPSELWTWVAMHELERLEPAVASGAKLAAVLGDPVDREMLEAIQEQFLAERPVLDAVDASVLLERLSAAGVMERGRMPGHFCFQSSALAAGVAALVDDTDRLTIHRLALAYQQRQRQPNLALVSRHAIALGDGATAARAESSLAAQAASSQRIVEAEIHYSNALAHAEAPSERAALLIGRAATRSRCYRLREAVDDLMTAKALASQLGDERLHCEASLQLATVLDWDNDYEASALVAEDAARCAPRVQHLGLTAQSEIARGRSAWRRGTVDAAIAILSPAVALAKSAGEDEARTIGLLLLGCALVQAKRVEEGELYLGLAIDHADAQNDRLHLCAGLGNRAFVWAARGEPERCVEDLSRAVRVARELGHPATERTALLNLAEVLYWAGREHDALPFLEQARVLEDRFLSKPVHSAVLLLARIAAQRGEYLRASEHLGWLRDRDLPPRAGTNAHAFHSALRHVLRAAGWPDSSTGIPLTWPQIDSLGPGLLEEERLELQYWAAHHAWLSSRGIHGHAGQLLSHHIWGPRLKKLYASIAG